MAKKPAKVASRKTGAATSPQNTAVKDDGHLYGVFATETRARVYPGPGVTLGEAERLATTLAASSYIRRLDEEPAAA